MKKKLISDETYAKIAHMTWNELAHEYEKLEEDIKKIEINTDNYADENEALREFIATILCWRPAWTQTTYFKNLSEELRNNLIELAKSTKHEGSGGIDDEWLDALQKETP